MSLCRFAKGITYPLRFIWICFLGVLGWLFAAIFGRGYKRSIYGRTIRRTEFLLDDKIIPLNHGGSGTVPRAVLSVQRQFQDETEKCPDVWSRYKLQPLWEKSLKAAADFVGAKFDNIVFVQNTSNGINAVLRSVELDEGDAILITNQTYGAVEKTTREVCQSTGCKLLVLNITYPTVDFEGSAKFYINDIVQHFTEVLQKNSGIKLAVVDYIGSSNAVLYPVRDLIDLCHQHDVAVLVDGAHTPGQVPLNLEELGADFFVGNLHKWLFAPRGCAILWVHPKYHDVIDPLVVSWYQDRSLREKFFMQGTLDYSPFVTAKAAIKFYQEIGGMESLTSYNQGLVSWASSMLASEWNTEILPVPLSMRAPFLAVIRLPDAITAYYGATDNGAEKVTLDLYKKFKVVVHSVCIQSCLWCRIAAQVYNTREDYLGLADAVKEMRNEALTMALLQSVGNPAQGASRVSWLSSDDQD